MKKTHSLDGSFFCGYPLRLGGVESELLFRVREVPTTVSLRGG
jgi:hypothetical protein